MTGATDHDEAFTVAHDHLVRPVVPRRGPPLEHRCPRTAFEAIARAPELLSTESGDPGFTLQELARAADLTPVAATCEPHPVSRVSVGIGRRLEDR